MVLHDARRAVAGALIDAMMLREELGSGRAVCPLWPPALPARQSGCARWIRLREVTQLEHDTIFVWL
jgi:hypothetical protein